MADDFTTEQIAAMLNADAERIATSIMGRGERNGRELVWKADKSLVGAKVAVVTRGPKTGLVMIYDGAGEKGQGILGLIYHTIGGRDWPVTFDKAREFLGLPPRGRQIDPLKKAAMDREYRERKARAEAAAQREAAQKEQTVREIWSQTKHINDTPALAYIRNRGLMPHHLPTDVLRFHPSLHHHEGRRWPALIAKVVDVENNGIAIWRIWLTPDGQKAPVNECKMGLGPALGGSCRLGHEPTADTINVVEGLETGLAVREWLMWREPVWCGLSTSGMVALELPDRVRFIRIWPDGDKPRTFRKDHGKEVPLPPGQVIEGPGIRAAKALAAKCRDKGRTAWIEDEPDAGMDYLDRLVAIKSTEKNAG